MSYLYRYVARYAKRQKLLNSNEVAQPKSTPSPCLLWRRTQAAFVLGIPTVCSPFPAPGFTSEPSSIILMYLRAFRWRCSLDSPPPNVCLSERSDLLQCFAGRSYVWLLKNECLIVLFTPVGKTVLSATFDRGPTALGCEEVRDRNEAPNPPVDLGVSETSESFPQTLDLLPWCQGESPSLPCLPPLILISNA